jgi:hypothetical protein
MLSLIGYKESIWTKVALEDAKTNRKGFVTVRSRTAD